MRKFIVLAVLPVAALAGCAEWQGAVTATGKAALQVDDNIRLDEAAALVQARCRLPYSVVQTLAARTPNFAIAQQADCGPLAPLAPAQLPDDRSAPSIVPLTLR